MHGNGKVEGPQTHGERFNQGGGSAQDGPREDPMTVGIRDKFAIVDDDAAIRSPHGNGKATGRAHHDAFDDGLASNGLEAAGRGGSGRDRRSRFGFGTRDPEKGKAEAHPEFLGGGAGGGFHGSGDL